MPTISFNHFAGLLLPRYAVGDVVCDVTIPLNPNTWLPSGQSIWRSSFCFQPHVRVVGKHLGGYVPRNSHDGLVACLGFGQFGDRAVTKIVEAQPSSRAFAPTDIGLALFLPA